MTTRSSCSRRANLPADVRRAGVLEEREPFLSLGDIVHLISTVGLLAVSTAIKDVGSRVPRISKRVDSATQAKRRPGDLASPRTAAQTHQGRADPPSGNIPPMLLAVFSTLREDTSLETNVHILRAPSSCQPLSLQIPQLAGAPRNSAQAAESSARWHRNHAAYRRISWRLPLSP